MTGPQAFKGRHSPDRGGPLHGVRVIELAGLGPGPHAATLLADLGADVVRVERPNSAPQVPGVDPSSITIRDPQLRNRDYVEADLKDPAAVESILSLIDRADVLLEGFRPGVTERLGLGPDVTLERNPRLVYARMTGWGQDGPYAHRVGHDINYIAATGLLHAIGRSGQPPVPPLNLVGDLGGGSMFLVFGVLAALVERASSGRGQVVDAAMLDGALALSHVVWSLRGMGAWSDDRGTNLLDTGVPYYDTYQTADGKFMAVGALEPQFYAALLEGLGLHAVDLPAQTDPAGHATLRRVFAEQFASKTREDWTRIFDGLDACVSPVLAFGEVPGHPQIAARGSLLTLDGVTQHAPAPRFSRTPSPTPTAPPAGPTPITAVWIDDDANDKKPAVRPRA